MNQKMITVDQLEQSLNKVKKEIDNSGSSIPNPLPTNMGGTGAQNAEAARNNLNAAAKSHKHEISDINGLNIPTAGTVTPKADSGSGSVGTSSKFAREDHVHPGSSIPNPLPTNMGGTGNQDGYIRTGQKGGTSIGTKATAEGNNTTASGDYSHAEGGYTTTLKSCSHAEGESTTASGYAAHAEGVNTTASGNESHAGGWHTIASSGSQMVIGEYNRDMGGSGSKQNSDATFVIGKGSRSARANCFRVGFTQVWGGTYQSSGADYAEMFEWEDGNPEAEDRVGRFVMIDGDKIRYASENDIILGITSANPSICGDTYDDQWQGMYMTDVFGRPIYEDVIVPAEMDEAGNEISPEHTVHKQKLNPEYNIESVYTGRSNRPEWAAVGIIGKLVMLQDGSLNKNDFVKPGKDGIATKSNTPTNCRVMTVIDESHVKVFIK